MMMMGDGGGRWVALGKKTRMTFLKLTHASRMAKLWWPTVMRVAGHALCERWRPGPSAAGGWREAGARLAMNDG